MGNSDSAPAASAASPEDGGPTPGEATDGGSPPRPPRGADSPRQSKGRQVETDITVYGATGFVGRHVCNYLVQSARQRAGEAVGVAAVAASPPPPQPPNPEDDTDYDAVRGKTEPPVDAAVDDTTTSPIPRIDPLRITLAGRSASKLDSTLQSLKSHPDYSAHVLTVDTYVADADDTDGLKAMASRTRVVLNCAGPFARYGTNVVGACATTGADYVDITGEVKWAGDMRSKFGVESAASGSRIISFCGFDSVPSDLAVYAAVRALRDGRTKKEAGGGGGGDGDGDGGDGKEETVPPPLRVIKAKTWHACFGLANGGTLHSALDIPVDHYHMLYDGAAGPAEEKKKLRRVPYLLDHPFHLSDPKVRDDRTYDDWRDRAAMSEWTNQLISVDTELTDTGVTVSAPFFMAVCNSKVVHASALALGYYAPPKDGHSPNGGEEAFTYWERYLPAGFDLTRKLGVLSAIPALSYSVILTVITATFKAPVLGRKLADWLLPPGSGVPDHINEMGYATVYAEALATAAGGSDEEEEKGRGSGNNDRVDRGTCRLSFEGDPGNLVTAQCVSEAALALVYDRDDLPAKSEDGFGTPAQLLGDALIARLLDSRVRRVTMETSVVENDRRYKWERYGGVVVLAGAVGLALRAWW